MRKFTCGHCGGRLAVNPRNLEKLVVCPECGKATHPLAVDILAAAKPKAEPSARACENCGRTIGKLEKVELWDNHVVCATCYPVLSGGKPLKAEAKAPEPIAKPSLKRLPTPKRAKVTKGRSAALPGPAVATPIGTVQTVIDRPAAVVDIGRADRAIAVHVSRTDGPPGRPGEKSAAKVQQRLLMMLLAAFVVGCALYGALTLLQNVMGYLLTIATVLVGAALVLAALKIGLTYLRKRLPGWGKRSAADPSATTVLAPREAGPFTPRGSP